MPQLSEAQREAAYQAFIADLTELTRRHGVAIQAVGGVYVAFEAGEFSTLTYSNDRSSRDLLPNWP